MNVIDSVLVESLSREHLDVMKALNEPRKDLDLAKDLGLEDTQVRIILNDLHERKLVSYRKTKNNDTGWVTHYWSRREEMLSHYTQDYLKKRINSLDRKLHNHTKNLNFKCGCKVVGYDKAIDDSFECARCGEPYIEFNDPKAVEAKVVELTRLNSMLQQLT